MTKRGVTALSAFVAHGDVTSNLFREMIDALPVAVYTTDAEGRLTYVNPAAIRLSGRTPEIGTDRWCVAWKIFFPDGSPLAHDQCPMAVALRGTEVPGGIECIAERPDGSRFWFTPCPAAVRDGHGRIIGGINVLVDITDRKTAEIEASEQARAIIDATPECVKIVARDGTLIFMNAIGATMLGAHSPDEVIGRSVYDLVAPEDRERFRAFNERVCAGEKSSIEFDIVGLSGVRRCMESHAAPLRHTDGVSVNVSITREITERSRAEKATHLLSAIVDSSDDAIISKDLNGVITSWNMGAERLFGYTAEEAIGRTVASLLIPADREAEEPDILGRLRRGERVDHFETQRRRKDGTLLDISLTISPVKDRNGKIIGASKIARDVTASRRLQDGLRRANEDLEQFAFSASHDLQEPLRTVKIYSDLLWREFGDCASPEAARYVKYLRSGATRMESLVRDLLAYTRVVNFELPTETADANEALEAALGALAAAVSEAGAQVMSEPLPGALPVHSTHLEQLFQNLIGNGIKYRSPERAPLIHISVREQSGQWVFSVGDNGIGIEPQYQENIFGLFKRLHNNDEYTGTGIGLAICQRIVNRYHGRIWVESERAQGSTFHFTLPV